MIVIDIVTNQRKRLSYFGVGRRKKSAITRTIDRQNIIINIVRRIIIEKEREKNIGKREV
jgi:hypothetical protein